MKISSYYISLLLLVISSLYYEVVESRLLKDTKSRNLANPTIKVGMVLDKSNSIMPAILGLELYAQMINDAGG